MGRRTRAPARLWRRSRPRSVRWRSTSRGFQGFFNALGGTAFADWLFMLGIGAALSFGFGMRVAAVTGEPLDTLMWVATFPLENSPMLHDRVLGAVSVVVLGFTLAGDTWGVGMAWARTQLVRAHPFLR